MLTDGWYVYPSDGDASISQTTRSAWLDPEQIPPWRRPTRDLSVADLRHIPPQEPRSHRRGLHYLLPQGEGSSDPRVQVNLALRLRRPLLVTGPPGVGKSSLADHLAWMLGLGQPLRWEINSRTTLADGLYHYDAVDHLRAVQEHQGSSSSPPMFGDFITLGPLGTALLPHTLPRVLLVDELDKSSYDLPNDLLHVFEEAHFSIPELRRRAGPHHIVPRDPATESERITLHSADVRAYHHPVMVVTSNGEREFPPAFRRRCVELRLGLPTPAHLRAVVARQLGDGFQPAHLEQLLIAHEGQATDFFLQALFLSGTLGAELDVVGRGLVRE